MDLHYPENNETLYKMRPQESWGDPIALFDDGKVKEPKKVLDFFRGYPHEEQRRSEVVLVVPTSSSVIKRQAISPRFRNAPISELAKLTPYDWEQVLDYESGFLEKQRVTTEMGILTLTAVLLALSEGRFPVTYVSAFCEGVLDRFLMNCYPVHEYPNGDIVLRYGLTPRQIRERIADLNPRIVGINCLTTSHHNDCIDIAKIVREIDPEIKIIVGGIHPTALDKYFTQHAYVDYVCRDEGDVTLPELIYRLLKGLPVNDVLGITYQEGDEIVRNPQRPFVRTDLVPWFLREAIPKINGTDVVTLYGLWNNGELVGNSTTMQSSRGCGFACYYCASGRLPFRHRSVDMIIAELEYLISQGYKAISDETDQVVLPVPVFVEYCKRIVERGINKRLIFYTPNGLLIDGLWKLGEGGRRLMLEAGYRDLCLAVEGSKDYVEKILNRRINVDLVSPICESFRRIAKELGVDNELTIRIFTQPGAPGETTEMRQEIIQLATDWVKKGYIDHVISFISTSISGAQFFERTMALLLQKGKENRSVLSLGGLIPYEETESISVLDELHIFELFERHHIWTRFRFGLTNLNTLFGTPSEEVAWTAHALESLTPQQFKWF
jgi:radical SAM superfamily enzyme YgiQ (UPF0313 family)